MTPGRHQAGEGPAGEDLSLGELRRRFVALTALRWFPTGLAVPVTVLLMGQRGLSLAAIGSVLAAYSVVTRRPGAPHRRPGRRDR
jgi:hypothetical protein